jgi:hypothetical protein
MYYFDLHKIISSLVTPLMDVSKRAREYIVEIFLNDAPLQVVRRLSVPSSLYVGHLVYELVYAMGWDGYHLTELPQGNTLWRSTMEKAMDAESGLEYEEIYPGMKVRNSFRATVSQLLKKVGDECSLLYDMGDSWHHTVRLLEIRRYEDNDIRFSNIGVEIISGEGACPPEDCGGVSGYEEILRIIKDPEEYEYERFRSLLGSHFDPEVFDVRSARRRIYDYERTIGEVLHGFYER